MSPGPPLHRPRRGFTILELAIALALISLAAALAIPAFYGRPEVSLDRAALLLARDLRTAQNHAVQAGCDVHFHLRSDGNGYAAWYESGAPLPNPAGGGPLARAYDRDAVFEGVRITRVQLDGHPREVRFDRLGFAHGGGTIELFYRGRDVAVHVAESTGLVTIRGLSRGFQDDGL